MSWARWLLFPFTVLYKLVTDFRNHLYNIDHKKSFEFEANVISVGNLSVGGTGKTPMVEYLINMLKDELQLATLSRGYGRKTRGYLKTDSNLKPRDIGDEPYQYFLKFGDKVTVHVGEERAWAIPNILMDSPETDIILMDDGYQHRPVKPSLSILLTTFQNPFYADQVMPVGRLREARKGARRSDILIVTKCPPDLSDEDQVNMTKCIKAYTDSPVFFTSIQYGKVFCFHAGTAEVTGKVLLVSGLANGGNFERYATENWDVVHHFRFRDHHKYTNKDIDRIKAKCELLGATSVITTEKDWVKLREYQEDLGDLRWSYLPIEFSFLQNNLAFEELVKKSIKSYPKYGEPADEGN